MLLVLHNHILEFNLVQQRNLSMLHFFPYSMNSTMKVRINYSLLWIMKNRYWCDRLLSLSCSKLHTHFTFCALKICQVVESKLGTCNDLTLEMWTTQVAKVELLNTPAETYELFQNHSWQLPWFFSGILHGATRSLVYVEESCSAWQQDQWWTNCTVSSRQGQEFEKSRP